ncbi:hypothetical protein HM1_1534 [Heliomicrobium modesticaldum Ice1]|uniref:Uncharacterized protein n=1 Tax=Heliobacterium modesticaldum (strain ATCC 51547 / Ice1) TaxID=498761 RepID=B0TD65_HELMI|nr:hypothetical protein HM1_1534 [Heliomicrobium modesticaldum Ice1]
MSGKDKGMMMAMSKKTKGNKNSVKSKSTSKGLQTSGAPSRTGAPEPEDPNCRSLDGMAPLWQQFYRQARQGLADREPSRSNATVTR